MKRLVTVLFKGMILNVPPVTVFCPNHIMSYRSSITELPTVTFFNWCGRSFIADRYVHHHFNLLGKRFASCLWRNSSCMKIVIAQVWTYSGYKHGSWFDCLTTMNIWRRRVGAALDPEREEAKLRCCLTQFFIRFDLRCDRQVASSAFCALRMKYWYCTC